MGVIRSKMIKFFVVVIDDRVVSVDIMISLVVVMIGMRLVIIMEMD